MQWIPAPALFIVFILTFFPWVGVYPGGIFMHSQNAYLTAFGGYFSDPDIPEKDTVFEKGFNFANEKADKPGFGPLMLFFLLAFFPAILLAGGALALTFFGQHLPPGMKALERWRWAFVAGFVLIALGFLWLQMLVGFNLEQSIRTTANKFTIPEIGEARNPTNQALVQKSEAQIRGFIKETVRRTIWLDLVVFLLVLTLMCSLVLFWIDFRGNKPLPRVDVIW